MMNKIYKVIWNAALQCWVAVSELGKAKGKTKSKKVLSAAAVLVASAIGISSNAEAAVNYSTGGTFGGGMAIGSSSYANTNAIAYGHEANARALEDVAIGYKTISGAPVSGGTTHVSAQASVAVGTYANATHVATTAIGAHANAIENFATAVGAGALASRENGSAFGQGAMATGVYATALGKGALAKQDYSIALGKEAAANTQLTTSIGSKTNATGFSAIAIGSGHVPATGNTVIENIQGAQATADDSMAVGASALANKVGATALGKLSKATNNNAVAVGPDSVASGSWATATGASSKAIGQASAAFGESATASGKTSIATGSHASASGENAIASGKNAKALASNTIAIGADASATNNAAGSLVIGRSAVVNATDATVVGPVAQANGANATAVGRGAAANGTESTALGRGAVANGNQSTALGKGSQAKVDSGVALGDGAVADRVARKGSEIVINNNKPSASTGFNDQDAATSNSVYAPVRLVDAPGALQLIKNTVKGNKGAVSVGDSGNTRQIINVAPGSADSDAVNVAQLKAVAGGIKKYSVTSPDGSITITNPATGDEPQNFQIQMNTTAVQNAAAWNIKSGSERGNGEQVRGGQTVTFAGSDTINVVRNGKTLTFNANISSISNGRGANEGKPQTTDNDNKYLAKTKNVVDAINNSGWTLQANGNRVGLVNPGDKVNIKAGTGVTITPTNENGGVSTLTISAAQQNYSWKLKEDSQTAAQALNVTNNTAVSLKGENFLNITNKGGGNFAFKTVTADVAYTAATGAVNAVSSATGLVTNKNLSDVIRNSGFQLKENGTLKNVVNPGESLNFKPGKGTTVSVSTNGDVQVNANVAGITAGKNISTTTDANGNVTINAKDTSAHVKAANNAAVKVDKALTTRTENNADITDYTVDLTDQTKTNITHGVNANETVTNKGLTFVANKGDTGIKKLGSTVDVKGNTSNNVITTTANTNGITVDYNGTAAAQVTNLTYKANNANAKSVTLAKGLDFTNGTQTTAVVEDNGVVKFNVNTTALSSATGNGNIQVPTGANSDGLVSAKNVANAINTSGWNLQANNVSVGLINPSDKVSFDAGNGVTVTSTNEANGVSHIKVAAKVDGSTITVNDQGQLVANLSGAVNTQASVSNATSSPITIATTQNANGTNHYTVDVNVDGTTITKENGVLKAKVPPVETVDLTVNKTGGDAGKVAAPTTDADKKKLVTAENVVKAINESFWVAKKGDRVETNADTTSGDSNIAAGNNVTFVAGKNIALQKDGNKFVYATKDDVVFNNVTANNTTTTNLTVKNGGNVDMGNNQVHNIANGTISNNSKDAVNGSQLYAVDNKFNNTVILGGENNSATEAQKLNKDGGLKFNIVGAENGNITTTASGTDVKIDLTEGTKKDIKQGVDANTTVTNKGLTFNANTGNTGAKKLGSEVDVKGGTANNVITTTATEAGITINYNGTEAAKVTHLTYKANGANEQNVSLATGLNFKNGNGTTVTVGANGEVTYNANVSGLTAGDNVQIKNDGKGNFTIAATDTNTQSSVVNATSSPVTVAVSDNANGTKQYAVDVNVDGKTITKEGGVLKAVIPAVEKVDLTVNKTGDNAGKVEAPKDADKGKLVTAENVAKAINESYWVAKRGDSVTTNADSGDGDSNVAAGNNVTFVAGKNMALQKAGNKFIYATKDDVVFNNVTANNTTTKNLTVKNGGNVDMGGNQVHNVSTGTALTDAVNVKQLYDTVSGNVSTESVIKKADEDNIAEVTVADNKKSGDKNAKYEVSVSKAKIKDLANETVKVNTSTATNNPITVTPHTENGNTTYTVNFNGTKAASEIPLTYKSNGDAATAKTVKLSSGLDFTNGTLTTAEVGENGVVKFNVNQGAFNTTITTTNGSIAAPNKDGVATVQNVVDAVNAAHWNLNVGGATVQAVKAGDFVNFANGKGTTVEYDATSKAVKVNANVSGLTAGNNITIEDKNKDGNFTISATDTNTQASVEAKADNFVTVDSTAKNQNGTTRYQIGTTTAGVTVNTDTGAVTVPGTASGLTTDKAVAEAISKSGFQLKQRGEATAKSVINPGEVLNFNNGTATIATVDANGNVKYDVNVDGKTITLNNEGKLVANVPDTSKVSLSNNAGKVGDVSAEDANKLVTGDNLAKTINATYWKASQGTHEETTSEETTGVASSEIKPGDELTFVSGKNMALKKDGNKFIYATKDDVVFNNVTANNTTTKNLTVKNGGNVDMGGNQVHNVSTGTALTDAVNVKQLYDTVSGNVSTESVIKKADEDNIAEVTVADNKKSGDKNAKYEVSVSKAKIKDLANETVKVNTSTATNNPITVTPHTENGNTTYTVNFDGTKAAAEIPLTYKSNGDAATAKTVKLSSGLDFTNGTLTTAEVGENGVVKFNVNTTALSNVTNNGKITVPDGNGLVTAKEVAEAINASYWKANAGGNVDGATVTDNVTTGTEVFFAAGKNLKVKHSANNFTFSTADDVSFTNVTTNNFTVNKGGNVDMGGNQVHNVANGTKGTDAVNLDQLNATTATANAGWVIKANGTNATTVKPNATVSLNNTDGNILITKNTANNNVTFNFNPNATFGVVGKDGKDGVDGSIGVNGKDGASVVINGKDGSIGLTGPKGADGKDGVSLTLKPEKGTTTVNEKDANKEIERIKYTANGTTREVATLDDGLKFAGDDNAVINRTLGSLLNITGGAEKATVADNIRVTNDGKNGLKVQLSNNVTFNANGSVKVGDTTVNNGGLTITGGPSITKDGGVNAGDKVISNVSTGVKDNDAVNVKQLKDTVADSVSTESVIKKADEDNIAEVSPKAGQTVGDKNATYEVSVSKAKVKDAAVEAVKVNATTGSPITVTTTADAANNSTTYTVNFNGDNAAKEIPLTYKSNGNASTAKTVKLSDGLDFTNGTLTTAEVGDNGVVKFNVNQGAFNTTTADANGKLNNASKEGVSTVEDVIKAVNAAGWVVTSGNTSTGTVSGTSREVINPGDAVKFIAGQNVDITQDKGNFTIATRENVSFTTVTVGKDGKNGKDGLIGVNGKDGASVVINGKDGSIGLTGPKGADGKDGVSVTLKPEKGTTTVNATDGGKEIDRIKYTDTNGTTREVATLDDGLKFKGDSSQVINRTLGSQMNITGGANETTLTDNNIGVVYDKATDGLKVKLAKDVNLTSNGSVTIGNTTLNNNGFTITNKADPSKTVSVTDKGLNNGGNTITNVAPGVNGTDAVNLDQLNATTAIANAGWVIKANGTNATTVKPNATVSLNNTDGNILITKNKTDNNVTFNLNPNTTFGVKGKDGVDGSIGVNSKNGSSVVIKDGSIGLNGKDGKNGLSIKGDQGPVGVDGKDGETKTRIVYEYADPQDPNKTIRENVATLNDGLIFTGNNGIRNNHKLNTLVTIIGEGVDKAASANFTSASGNINVKADGKGTLEVQLAKNLKNIETINNGNSTITLNKDGGTTISGGDVSVDGNKVTNVKDGDVSANSKDAVNGSQLYHVMTNATAGWNLSVNNGKDKGNVKPGAQVDLNNTDGNIIISKTANNVTFNFNPNATFGVKGKDGKDGVDGSIGVNGKDGASVVINGKDGSIGLTGPKGADGKDGASANMSVQKGTTTVNTDRDGGKEVTRIVYTDKDKDGKDIKREVATLDDGLKFKGDSEQVINRTLGSQMNITGGADSTKLTDNNIGVVYDEATNGLKVKLSKDVDLGKDGSITIGGTQVTNNGLTIKGGPSVTEKGVDAGNKKVTNVADGDINSTSKDAVNGSQLYQAVNNINKNVNAAKTELEEGDNVTITSRVGNNGQTIYKVSSTDNSAHVQGGSDAVSVTKAETTRKDGSTTVTDYTVDLSSKTKDDIKKGVDAHDTVTNKGLTFNADKGTTGAKKLGSQVAVNGDNKNIETVADTNGVKVKLKDDINVNSVTANTFKAGDTIVNTKGVQVAAKDDRGNNTNVVINEKGINAGNTRIQNVAAGRADTDAVNVSQLKGAVTQIGNHINKMDKNLRAGVAGAMAAGGLYHATLPGKSMVAAGAGTYKGESAVAVGYSRLSDNGKVGIKFSVNTNTRGDAGAAASVGYQW